MDWFRRSKGVPLEEHRRQIEDAEKRLLYIQQKLRDEAITVKTLDDLSEAYENYLKVSTEEVEYHDNTALAV